MPKLKTCSIRTNLLIFGILLSIVPLILAGIFIVQSVQESLIEQAERELNIVTQAMALELSQFVDELAHDAQLMADLPVVQSMDQELQSQYLSQLYAHHQRYGQLAVIGLDGQILLTAKPQDPVSITHIESFQSAARGIPGWVVAPALFNDDLIIHMHSPIWSDSSQSEQVGVLGSPVSFDQFTSILDKYDHNMPKSVFVLGSDDRVLIHLDSAIHSARPDYAQLTGSRSLRLAENNRIDGTGNITFNTAFSQGGQSFVASITEIDSLGWTVVAQKKQSVVFQPLRMIRAIVGVIISILILLNISLYFYVRKRITDPISALAMATVELEANNPEALLPSNKNQYKEIQKLIESFTSMRDAVKDREQTLQDWSSTLEKKVGIRTAELRALNQYLEKEIEEHKQTAMELEQSRDEAQMANKVKDTFLARMSHELRTPLNAIIGYSELIRESAVETHNNFLANDAETISIAARHLSTIINNVLAYSEIQSDSLQLSSTNFEIDDLIGKVQSAVRPLAERNGNRMIINNHTNNEELFSDEYKIRQIVLHLMSNAAKFTQHGTISLDVQLKHIGDWDAPMGSDCTWLNLHISDTGIGIVEDSLESIFYPFLQVEGSFDRAHEGAGLGLVLTQNFVELLGGNINVKSEVGFGTNIEVAIPVELFTGQQPQEKLIFEDHQC
ncbi:MAG: ATP-binding protein [Chloroflexota bacterium]